VASNGGLALIYLQNRTGHWADPPQFERDVLPVAQAFWQAHRSGAYAPELQGSLAGVLVRNVEREGWNAPYLALVPPGVAPAAGEPGELVGLEAWFAAQPPGLSAGPLERLQGMAGPLSGDLVLISDSAAGYYFAGPVSGVHGGLHPDESWASLAIGWPGVPVETWQQAEAAFRRTVEQRSMAGSRQPLVSDLMWGLLAVLGLPASDPPDPSGTYPPPAAG
jgi:hypothetical protein